MATKRRKTGSRSRTSKSSRKAKKATPRRQRRVKFHPLEFRLRVVDQVLEEEVPVSEVARAFRLSPSTINAWLRKYEEGGVDALTPAAATPKPRRADGV